MNFENMTDQEIRAYAASLIAAQTGNPAEWYNTAALYAQNGMVGMLHHANFGAHRFDPVCPIDHAAQHRLDIAQACFRW